MPVRFEGNRSAKWDGKESEVPGRTVVRLGWRGEDGLERAEVHWPGKGKAGKVKVWRCVVLKGEEEEGQATTRTRKPELGTCTPRPAAEDLQTRRTPAAPPRRRGPRKGKGDELLAAVVDRARLDEERDEKRDKAVELEAPVAKKPRTGSGWRDSGKPKSRKGEQLNFTCVYRWTKKSCALYSLLLVSFFLYLKMIIYARDCPCTYTCVALG